MFEYRVGARGWKIAAKIGLPLTVVVNTLYDKKAGRYAGHTDDFKPYLGIGTEAETFEELKERFLELFEDGMLEVFDKPMKNKIRPVFILVPEL